MDKENLVAAPVFIQHPQRRSSLQDVLSLRMLQQV
jgi:hypothetical protein